MHLSSKTNLFLTVLEARKFRIKVLADLVFGKSRVLHGCLFAISHMVEGARNVPGVP